MVEVFISARLLQIRDDIPFHIRNFSVRYVEYIQMMVLFYIRKIHQIHGGFCYPQEFHGRRFPPPSWGSFLYFLGFFCLEEENAITYVVGFMEIGVVIALFPLFFGKKEAGLAAVAVFSCLGWWRSGGEKDCTQITGGVRGAYRLRTESSPLSFRFYSKEVERWGCQRFLRIPISL